MEIRLRAHDHDTSSTLIGGKGGAGPSLLHTTLEGPMEYVNARWMSSLHGFLHGIEMDHVPWSLELLSKPPLRGNPNAKPGDHGTPNAHNRTFILSFFIMCEDPHETKFIETTFR